MPLRLAKASEAETLYSWILGWSAWFKVEGIDQWNPPYPFVRFQNELEAGQVTCYEDGGGTRAMVTLLRNPPDYHPPGIWTDEPALYVCRLVGQRDLSGLGFGGLLLGEIEGKAIGEGFMRLRLDAVASNPFLAGYWRRAGFLQVAQAAIRGAPTVFMEKDLVNRSADALNMVITTK